MRQEDELRLRRGPAFGCLREGVGAACSIPSCETSPRSDEPGGEVVRVELRGVEGRLLGSRGVAKLC